MNMNMNMNMNMMGNGYLHRSVFQSYEDEYTYFDRNIKDILGKDDVEQFKLFIKSFGYMDRQLLIDCLRLEAEKCTLALLQGELTNGCFPHSLINASTLAEAVDFLCRPTVIKLLLDNCNGLCNLTSEGLFPLDCVLLNLSCATDKTPWFDPLDNWSPGQSFIKLLILLCQPQVKDQLECARMIAERTQSVHEFASGYILQGKLVQLAGLLLVDHEHAMAPFVSSDGTIKPPKCLSQSDSCSRDVNAQRSRAWAKAAGLLEIFHKTGDKLSQCCWSLQGDVPPQEVIIQVANVIQEAGIPVTHKDVDLTDVYRFEPRVKESIFRKLGIEMEDKSRKYKVYQKPVFPTYEPITPRPKPYTPHHPAPSTLPNQRPFSVASQVLKSSSRNSGAFPSLMELAYLAMKFKRGAKYL